MGFFTVSPPDDCGFLLIRSKFMAIPNTTPTPNIIFNGLMAKMSDTEFRVVMVVVRATLGWEIDHKTGMRKKEDWISHRQLIEKTGRSGRAISTAIDSCIKKGWIEARDEKGNLLDVKEKRVGKKIFYRLGKEILLKDDGEEILVKEYKPLKKVQRLETTSEKSSIEKSSIEKSSVYKRKTITKEKLLQNNNIYINNLKKYQNLKKEFLKGKDWDNPFRRTQAQEEAAAEIRPSGRSKGRGNI